MWVLGVLFGELIIEVVNSGDECVDNMDVLIWILLFFKVFFIVVIKGVVLVVIGLWICDWVFFL